MVENRRKLLDETAERAERLAKKHEEIGSSQKVIDHYKKEAEVCRRELYKDIYGSYSESGSFFEGKPFDPFGAICKKTAWLAFWPIRKLPKRIQNILKRLWGFANRLWDAMPLPNRFLSWDFFAWMRIPCCMAILGFMVTCVVSLLTNQVMAGFGESVFWEYALAFLLLVQEGAKHE